MPERFNLMGLTPVPTSAEPRSEKVEITFTFDVPKMQVVMVIKKESGEVMKIGIPRDAVKEMAEKFAVGLQYLDAYAGQHVPPP